MKLTLNRHTLAGDGTFGDLLVDGVFVCHTVERTAVEIPAGDYQLLPHASAKPCLAPWGGATVALHAPALNVYAELSMVPAGVHGARYDCLLHPGNWPDELLGCIAPGEDIAQVNGIWGVTNSRAAFAKLVALWGDRTGLTATITESYSP